MPWSEWIQSDPYERGTSARYRMATQTGATNYTGATLDEVAGDAESTLYSTATTETTCTVYGRSAGVNPGASRSENYSSAGTGGVWTGGIVQTQGVAWFDTGDLELATWREWFPPEFNDLTEGVDYELRPDRTGTEDDAFIQYEDGVGQIESWFAFASGRISSHSASYEPKHATAKWRLLSPPPAVPAVPPVNGSVAAPPLAFTPDAGAPVTQIVNSTISGFPSAIPVNVNVAGPVSEFAVLVVTDESMDTPFVVEGVESYSHEWSVIGLPAAAAAFVRLPRWRYWKPGELPLRQKQRDDGLALRGAPSWRQGSSRQASNRWRSYL